MYSCEAKRVVNCIIRHRYCDAYFSLLCFSYNPQRTAVRICPKCITWEKTLAAALEQLTRQCREYQWLCRDCQTLVLTLGCLGPSPQSWLLYFTLQTANLGRIRPTKQQQILLLSNRNFCVLWAELLGNYLTFLFCLWSHVSGWQPQYNSSFLV